MVRVRTKNAKSPSLGGTAEELLAKARECVDTLRPDEAVKFFRLALKKRPQDVTILDDFSEVLMDLGEVGDAYEVLH